MKTPLLLSFLLLAGCATHTQHGIDHLATVSPGNFRGGQPTAEGWKYLKSQDVRYVLKLNTEAEGSDQLARDMGMTVIDLPIDLAQQTFGPIPGDKIIAFFEQHPGNWFVHCEHGVNRTGTAVALYRLKCCGWTKAQAQVEMDSFGWRDSLPGLQWYWYFDVK